MLHFAKGWQQVSVSVGSSQIGPAHIVSSGIFAFKAKPAGQENVEHFAGGSGGGSSALQHVSTSVGFSHVLPKQTASAGIGSMAVYPSGHVKEEHAAWGTQQVSVSVGSSHVVPAHIEPSGMGSFMRYPFGHKNVSHVAGGGEVGSGVGGGVSASQHVQRSVGSTHWVPAQVPFFGIGSFIL